MNTPGESNFTPVKKWIKDFSVEFEGYKKYCKSNNWIDDSDKETEFDFQRNISLLVGGRVEYFVKEFKPFLEYKYSKDFIALSTDIINIFLDRCSLYRKTTTWTTITNKGVKQEEMIFSEKVFSSFIKIRDGIYRLNLDNEVNQLSKFIFGDKPIPLTMKTTMEEKYPKIVEYKKNIYGDVSYATFTPHDILNSTEMYINIKNPPVYDINKHYFEQSKEVIDFYNEEFHKIKYGVKIAGVFIHPWLYWHINFFTTDIPMDMFQNTPYYDASKERLIHPPFLRDNEIFLAECYKRAEESNVGLFIFGTRRAGKTVIEASILSWRTTTVEHSESIVIGGDEGDLSKLTKTIEIAFSNINPAFRLPRNNSDWDTHIQFGLKDKAQNKTPYSEIFIRNINGGQKKGSVKTAGATPTAWIVDEAGKFECKKMYMQAIPSFQNPYGWALVPILTGTGGDADLSKDAQEMLTSPVENRILPMDWNRLNDFVGDETLITWEKRDFGIFVPAQMSFKEGLIKKESNLSEFYKIDDEDLKKISIQVTDWEKSLRIIQEEREMLKNSKTTLNDTKMGYPIDPLECFMSKLHNPFPVVEARIHRDNLVKTGDIGKLVDIYKKKGTILGYGFSNKELPPERYEGGVVDAPVIFYEDPPEFDNGIDGTYVSGLDHYKQDKSSTDSLGSFFVYKRRITLNDPWGDRIVASYCARPETIKQYNIICEMLIEGYGAECLQENADTSLQQHLKNTFKDTYLLANGEVLAQDMINPKAFQNNKYGLNPNTKNQQFLLNLVINYFQEDIEVGEDEKGVKIYVKGVTRIPDIGLLNESINFEYGGNHDRIVAFGHALAWAMYLDRIGVIPKPKRDAETIQRENIYRKQLSKEKNKQRSIYGNKKYNPY